MICLPCRDAGKLLTAGDEERARDGHALCQKAQVRKAGKTWCDCHHGLTSCLNRLLVPVKEVVE